MNFIKRPIARSRLKKTNTGADGRVLEVQVEVTSPQLPEPIRYALTFARQSGPLLVDSAAESHGIT
jgi:hypothetical protein